MPRWADLASLIEYAIKVNEVKIVEFLEHQIVQTYQKLDKVSSDLFLQKVNGAKFFRR